MSTIELITPHVFWDTSEPEPPCTINNILEHLRTKYNVEYVDAGDKRMLVVKELNNYEQPISRGVGNSKGKHHHEFGAG